MMKVYEYKGCGTCRKARKYLDSKHVEYTAVPIREQPPTKAELKRMLRYYDGDVRRLFNTSGLDYKTQNIKEKIKTMSPKQAINLLANNGNLVKRPFILTDGAGLVGFKPEELERLVGRP